MGATLTRWEASIFTGDKNIVGSLELDGYLAADTTTGSEKVTNPNFTGAATGWTLGGAWAYNANAVDKNADGTTTLSQDVGAIANEIYRVVYTVSGWSVGTVTVAVGGVSGTARGADGTYTEYIKATGTGSLTFTPTNTARFTVDTVSVTRVGVAAADRVVAWVGDRVAAGVAQAADAGLYIMSEDGTLSFFGDSWKLGAGDDVEFSIPAADTLAIATGGTEALRVDGSQRLLIGGAAAYAGNGQLLEVNKSADDGGIGLFCWSATDAERALIEFHKSASATIGTKALVADEEAAGGIIWKVADGAVNWSPIASIEAYVDTEPGAGDTGGRLVLGTTADGAATVTEHLRINAAGLATFTSAGGIVVQGLGTEIGRLFADADTGGVVLRGGYNGTGGIRLKTQTGGTITTRVDITNDGYMGLGAVSPATLLELTEVKTITGAVTDGYSGALTLDPGYTAATALTVTRHNYIDVQNVSNAGAGPSAVTDACVLRFDAAAGTHKATVGATVKGTPVEAWVKINVNGTIHYMPAYTSTTLDITSVADTYIILATDKTIVCNKATPFTVTLPAAVVGQIFTIKNIGAGAVTVEGDGDDTIDGAASQNVVQWASLTVQCSAANTWIII